MKNPQIGSCAILEIEGHKIPAIVVNVFPGDSAPMVSVAHIDFKSEANGMYGREIVYSTSIFHADDEKNGNPCWSDIIAPTHGNFHMALDPVIVESNIAEPYEGP